MSMIGLPLIFVALFFCANLFAAQASSSADTYEKAVAPFLKNYCVNCHGTQKKRANFTVHDLAPGKDGDRWEKIAEMVGLGVMPPDDDLQPTRAEKQRVIRWIDTQLAAHGRGQSKEALENPEAGNRVSHEDLFSGAFKGPAYSPPRLFRMSNPIYDQLVRDLRISTGGAHDPTKLAAPFQTNVGHGFQSYATLTADEATLKLLLLNSDEIARSMIEGVVGGKDGKRESQKALLRDFQTEKGQLTEQRIEALIKRVANLLIHRDLDAEEKIRHKKFLEDSIVLGGQNAGILCYIKSVLLSPEFIFRLELGQGTVLPDGRRMLSPQELTYAISYAIHDRGPDESLRTAATEGRLQTRQDVAREVRRMLDIPDDPRNWQYGPSHLWGRWQPIRPAILRFFREYFGYHRAENIFKDRTRNNDHEPLFLIRDADILILSILNRDQNVLEELLTTEKYMVLFMEPSAAQERIQRLIKQEGKDKPPGWKPNPAQFPRNYISAYNLSKQTWLWPDEQPFVLPKRAGILTHPAWLTAHSGNFNTDPVRRGKWIREHLLADSIPKIPIGVDARVPEDPHKTLRERFDVVSSDQCWRCHKLMNPLGMAFESYDDFGRHREHFYFDGDQKLVEIDEKFEQRLRKEKFSTRPVDTTGELKGSGAPQLDGPVRDAIDLMRRLAKSERARQSFVRHAFRYWMGRNETLRDSPTLIAADKAYVESGGSFKALLTSLLTSDSFLYRKDVEE